ncbi:MAG TPA: phospholipid carrier-dependent glycosyltransferase, partial [Clostridia bacterium]|nr:phospholipid carrier-dependent glycosyltransferase [Clostridia bacterium]
TALLAREGGGRFDRLDVWVLVVLVIATLTLRTFRLGEPLGMHFDEVYHARTATEFLQHWRYGESHDIYEWTHPHLGKYAIAGGLVAFGEDRVKATSSIGAEVRHSLLEPQHDDVIAGGRIGARLWLATGSALIAYDLESRAEVVRADFGGARRLALDQETNALLVGTDSGEIRSVDLTQLDVAGHLDVLDSFVLAAIDGPVDRLVLAEDGTTVLAASGDSLQVVDSVTGETVATAEIDGLADLAEAGTTSALVATTAAVTDPAAVAARLAELLGGDAAAYEASLTSDAETVSVAELGNEDDRTAVDEALLAGELPGIEIEDVERVAVAAEDGVVFVDRATGGELTTLPLDGGAHGLVHVANIDTPRFYVTTGTAEEPGYAVVVLGSSDAGPSVEGRHPLPGLGSLVGYDEPTRQVHILGRTPDGTGSTVYVVEPHANAVYADARLPFEPVTWAFDVDDGRPAQDRQELLAFAADGSAATVDIGQHAFAWRMPGVIAGALMAGLLYVLARILFARRAVALLAGLFVLVEGMFFAQSRIAMNDVYVGLFIIAAYTVFAALWTGRWAGRSAFWIGFPLIGVLLGLALASKWVAAYAIGALVLLLLARSALGRVLLIVGMIGLTAVLGYLALTVPTGSGYGNLTFLLVMIALTLTAVIANVLHPIAWSVEEYRFAVLTPAVLGALVFFGALTVGRLDTPIVLAGLEVRPIEVALLLALVAPVAYLAFRIAGGYGFGPLAPPPAVDDPVGILEPPAPAPNGWLRPGWALGLPVAWAAACLVVIPLGVYVISYIPWAWIENHRIIEGWPAGHTGQTLIDLTRGMYDYHNQLTSAHAASSPWWAWPFDLKPVWFYQGGFGDGTAAAIYDSGNLVIWWLGVPAMIFVAWQAFHRRSLALALIAIGFAAQWISWARIDRAAFQYHYYTALPFVVLALAYFIAELWHGASRRTWMVAKGAAALAIVAPALMHLFSRPLCGFVNVEAVNPGSRACPAVIPDLVLTARTAGLAAVVGLSVLAFLLVIGGRLLLPRPQWARGAPPWLELALVGGLTVLGSVLVARIPDTPIFQQSGIPVEPIAALVLIPLGYLALQVLAARDARRFVGGIVIAAVVMFLVFYPNISALPLPSTMVNAYQGLLPTYLYDFQFPVNEFSRNVETTFASPLMVALLAGLVFIAFVVAYSAWTWRLALAERSIGPADDEGAQAPASSPG